MSLPYYPYTDLAHTFNAIYDYGPLLGEANLTGALFNLYDDTKIHVPESVPSLQPHSVDQGLPLCHPVPKKHCTIDILRNMSPQYALSEKNTVLNGKFYHARQEPEIVSAPESLPLEAPSSNVSYTRKRRGRKIKYTSGVFDEHRTHICDICQAAFARAYDLNRHIRIHTGETPYHCHGCKKGFKRSDARRRHWERDPRCKQGDSLRVRQTHGDIKAQSEPKLKKKPADM